jgi:RNA polymerase sigma-70 factor (ECF subfamily)
LTITNRAREATADDEVLAAAVQNDRAAFDVLYRRFVTRVYRYCYIRTNDVQAAEDLTAQTFLAALEGIPRYRGDSSFSAWLFGIASNRCKAYHRRRQRRPEEPLEEAMRLPDAGLPGMEHRAYRLGVLDCVENVLPHMSEDRQEVIRLRFLAG